MLFCAFALCDIDVDAYHPLWMPILTVRNNTARFDPSDVERMLRTFAAKEK